jgi:C_GCAxxG_C_C family probable redox protein
MNDDLMRMLELYRKGFNCSQILVLLGLDDMGKSNPDLVKAMAGLGGGLGFTGRTCGSLTGGACLLGLYAGKGLPEGKSDDLLMMSMISDLSEWFDETIGQTYGGIDCKEIIGDELANQTPTTQCANIISDTYTKIKEILTANGVDPADG